MTCGLRRSDYWPNREYGRRTFVRRCDLDAHYGACHAELRCATCGAATTRAGRHKCAAPWLEDYDVACPAGCGEVFRRSFLDTHAVGCVVSARELPGLPGLGRAAGGWTSDARFWRERGPPCWRRADDERGGNWPEIPDD